MKLRRLLLWMACRKHIGKVTSTHVWDSLKIETSCSPDIEMFKKFRDKGFDATPHSTAILHTKQTELLGEFIAIQTEKLKVLIEDECKVESYLRWL